MIEKDLSEEEMQMLEQRSEENEGSRPVQRPCGIPVLSVLEQ